MKKVEGFSFLEYLRERIMLLDGATGTWMQKNGMKPGVCPEAFAIENPGLLRELQQQYIEAGSRAVYTFTMGANPIKLDEFGLKSDAYSINKKLAEISIEAAGNRAFVGGDVSSTGTFLKPLGELDFEAAVEAYKEQIKALADGGVDFIVIETMIDIQETRAAIIAAKECCNLPVVASMTFDASGRTLTGTSPAAAAITLISAGADVVGMNCSTGPKEMLPLVRGMKEVSSVPLIVKPNAGMPRIVNGETHFDLTCEDFRKFVKPVCESGANLIGGCCGSDPDYIRAMAEELKGMNTKPWLAALPAAVTSVSDEIYIGLGMRVVGERINPTGKPKLKEALKNEDYYTVLDIALEQKDNGAHILDVNVGTTEVDERETMKSVIDAIAMQTKLPLSIDSSKPEVIESALRIYPGRALVNSVSAKKASMERLLPVVKRYNSMFILLPIGENGIPETAEGRINEIKDAYENIKSYGLGKENILVDGLVMAVSSNQDAAVETLKTVKWCSENGFNTILGISNGSFGLPERGFINAAYLIMAMGNGLKTAIMNPNDKLMMDIYHAAEVLTGKDIGFGRYMKRFAHTAAEKEIKTIEDAILTGKKNIITSLIEKEIAGGVAPSGIINDMIVPALKKVGELYEQKVYFLPHLIYSAEAARVAFDYLEKEYPAKKNSESKKKVVIATVKGDIHDIGKNLVAMLLRNNGFSVTDLGKDVDAEVIIDEAERQDADIIGLSALITTTAAEMKNIIVLAKKRGLRAKIMVGGAVVTEKYAKSIGADSYSEDAAGAVKEALRLTNKN